MRTAEHGKGFEWWGPHDRARHEAELLLGGIATICATYVATVAVAIVIAIRIGQLGSKHGLAAWKHPLAPVALVGFTLVLAALIAKGASESLAGRATRLAGARRPATGEAEHARAYIESFALGVGFPPPSVWVVDNKTPNGFATGRRRACAVCLTTSALKLPVDQLEALCAQTITSVANRALPLTCAAADLVLVARWCTKAIWATMGVLLVSTIVGVPPLFAAAATVAVALLVVCTMPLLAVADRAIPRLRDRSALLADLDAVGVTNQPAALARLLLTAASDYRTVATPWPIANLWFDPDTSCPVPRERRRFTRSMDTREPAGSNWARHQAVIAHRALVERARVLVDLTSGDPRLRAALDRAESR